MNFIFIIYIIYMYTFTWKKMRLTSKCKKFFRFFVQVHNQTRNLRFFLPSHELSSQKADSGHEFNSFQICVSLIMFQDQGVIVWFCPHKEGGHLPHALMSSVFAFWMKIPQIRDPYLPIIFAITLFEVFWFVCHDPLSFHRS